MVQHRGQSREQDRREFSKGKLIFTEILIYLSILHCTLGSVLELPPPSYFTV